MIESQYNGAFMCRRSLAKNTATTTNIDELKFPQLKNGPHKEGKWLLFYGINLWIKATKKEYKKQFWKV